MNQQKMTTSKMNHININPVIIRGKFIFLLIIALFQNYTGFAQENWDGTGEIEEAEVIIQKDRNIILPNALRIFEKVPDFSQPTGILGLSYTFKPLGFKPVAIPSRVRPLTIKTERLPSLKDNNIKVGYGNYMTPFLEANLGTGRNDQYLYNLFLHHRSSLNGPVDDKNSGDSESMVDFNGKVFLNKATLAGQLAYEREGFSFYGYDKTLEPLKEDIKQVLHQVTVTGSIENNLPNSEAKYSLKGKLDSVQDN